MTMIWEVSDPDTLYGADKPKPLAEWLLRRSGKLSSTVAEVVRVHAHARRAAGGRHPVPHGRRLLRRPRRRGIRRPLHAVIAPVLVSPKARGQVWLRSADPADKPRIITNTLSEPEDVESLLAGMALAREIAAQRAAARGRRQGAQAGPGRRTSAPTSKPTCAGG